MSVQEGGDYRPSARARLSPTLAPETREPGSRGPRARHARPEQRREPPWRPTGIEVLGAVLVIGILGRSHFSDLLSSPAVQTWATIFTAICVQAVPFLVMGVLISASIAAFVPASFFTRALPRRPAAAVPVAGVAGALLPGCECGAVPVAGGLVRRGVAPAAALAFLLSSPAINPIVLVATAVAFPDNPEVVLARFVASLGVAVIMGWLWMRFGKGEWMRPSARPVTEGMPPWQTFWTSARHDFAHAGGFLVVGGMTAATLNVVVPRSVLDAVADSPWLSILALALLAVLLAICSEADAFVAASLSQFSLTSRLAFMVIGPTVDVKLIALQAGTFGRGFAVRFAPATFVVGIVVSVLVGTWLL